MVVVVVVPLVVVVEAGMPVVMVTVAPPQLQ